MSGERRHQILRVAITLFARGGPRATRVAEVAKLAHVAVGTVYLEFPSKDALLGAVAKQMLGEVAQAMESALEHQGSFSERFAALFDARFDAYVELLTSKRGQNLFESRCCGTIRQARSAHLAEEQRIVNELLEAQGVARPQQDAERLLDAYAAFAPPLLTLDSADARRARLPEMHAFLLRTFA